MALYRTVAISFWTDSKVVDDFTPEDKYFFLYLFTNPHTNLAGCYEVSVRQMANETGYSVETIERLLYRFSNVHKVAYYSKDTKEIMLLNWHKYNWTKSDKYRKPLGDCIAKIKNQTFRDYLQKIYDGEECGYGIDTICIDTKYGIDTTNTNTITNTDTNSISFTDSKPTKDIDYSKPARAKDKPVKHKHGENKNVLLTDEELASLQERFPADWENRIENLSWYLSNHKDKYTSHYKTILAWARNDQQKAQTPYKSKTAQELDSSYKMLDDWVKNGVE